MGEILLCCMQVQCPCVNENMGAWISFGVILGICTQDCFAVEQKAFLIFPFAWEILRRLLQLFQEAKENESPEFMQNKRVLFQLVEEWSRYIKERRMQLEQESARKAEETKRSNGHKRSCSCAACSRTLCSPGLHISADRRDLFCTTEMLLLDQIPKTWADGVLGTFVDNADSGTWGNEEQTHLVTCYSDLLKSKITLSPDITEEEQVERNKERLFQCTLRVQDTDSSDPAESALTKGVMTFGIRNADEVHFFPVIPAHVMRGSHAEKRWIERSAEFGDQLEALQDDFAAMASAILRLPKLYKSYAFSSCVFEEEHLTEVSHAYIGVKENSLVLGLRTLYGGITGSRRIHAVGLVPSHIYANQLKVYVLEKSQEGMLLAKTLLDAFTAPGSDPRKVWSVMDGCHHIRDVTYSGMLGDMGMLFEHKDSMALAVVDTFFSSLRESCIEKYTASYKKQSEGNAEEAMSHFPRLKW